MRAAPNLPFCKSREPALDLVEPRGGSRREMDVEARVASKPVLDRWGLVRAVVVHHEVDIQISRNGSLDCSEKF